MAATLGDLLLVLLHDRPGSSHELRQRHAAALGPRNEVNIKRVEAALTRQQRLGYVRTEEALSRGRKRVWVLTDAGRRRGRDWLLEDGPGSEVEDVVVRALIALAADGIDVEAVVGSGVAALERRLPRPVAGGRHLGTIAEVRAAYEDETVKATLRWLRRLHARSQVA
ncbi:hypothetical protein [Actinoplanes sp. NPDC026619]|uniref:hypothetical protein n=1 Tax=Actinoplanes sp. NPDC026619 TaxID=3155798 RepID=UPI0033E99B79